MKGQLPGFSIRLITIAILGVISLLVPLQASAGTVKTTVNVTNNTGSNTINGVPVETDSDVSIKVNGKEYANDDGDGDYDIVDESNGGRTEVHIKSNKSTKVTTQGEESASVRVNSNVTPKVTVKPTVDIEPTMAKKKEEAEKKIEEAEKESDNLIEKMRDTFEEFIDKISSLFD